MVFPAFAKTKGVAVKAKPVVAVTQQPDLPTGLNRVVTGFRGRLGIALRLYGASLWFRGRRRLD
jgi:hypothetical protein